MCSVASCVNDLIFYCSVLGDKKADPNSFDDILTKYCIQWRGIGLKLGLEKCILDNIEADHPLQRECLEKTLDAWLKQDQDKATWGVLELAITNANRVKLALEPLQSLDSKHKTGNYCIILCTN